MCAELLAEDKTEGPSHKIALLGIQLNTTDICALHYHRTDWPSCAGLRFFNLLADPHSPHHLFISNMSTSLLEASSKLMQGREQSRFGYPSPLL